MASITPEQGPPLAVPMSFFATGLVALCSAGGFLAARDAADFASMWTASTVAAVHLGTVGFLLIVMCGALYQMLPVVAGAVMPFPKLGFAVLASLAAATVALRVGFVRSSPAAFMGASGAIVVAMGLFLGQAAWAMSKSAVKSPTAFGMQVALVALAGVISGGLVLAWARSGNAVERDFLVVRNAHAHLGLIGWVGGLVCAVSWQVLPMFYITATPSSRVTRVINAGVLLSVVALIGVITSGQGGTLVPWLILPGAVAVWLVEPAWALRTLWHRKRKRKDATLWFWWLAQGSAPLCFGLGAASTLVESAVLPMLYGVLMLWGWAGCVVHGMLTRIVPFLVWLHWCSPLVGTIPVPSMRDLLPDAAVARGFAAHAATLAVGLCAAMSASAWAWRLFGVGVSLTATMLLVTGIQVLVRGRRAVTS
jgi:hypothetical protein